MDLTGDGRPVNILTLIDEPTKEALAICRARQILSNDVIDSFADAIIERGIPAHISLAAEARGWHSRLGTLRKNRQAA